MSAYRENSRYKLTDGAHFSIDTRRIVEAHGRHWHSFFEMEIILSGKGRAICDGTEEILSAGDCHYCPQGSEHFLENVGEEDLRFYAVVPCHGE